MQTREQLVISGQVQGVGFRPFVFKLAREMGLGGFVRNTPGGVTIEIEGDNGQTEMFVRRLEEELPPLARMDRRERTSLPGKGETEFLIQSSDMSASVGAEVTIDTAVCDDCLRELFDPADRRYRYPFINCTNCGPRYTIVRSVPYDRVNTTMAGFVMCDRCRAEYENPQNRRFHAQPVACPTCGPTLSLVDPGGNTVEGDPIRKTADLLREGRIVAIKGIGGFHLAVDATNEKAVRRLRQHKKRDEKPFALMVGSETAVSEIAESNEPSRQLLSDVSRPIVLLPKRENTNIAPSVAPGMATFGIMLPYAPQHYLLFAEGLGPLVMTSGNISDEPIVGDNDDARLRLGQMADAFLMHDRPIYRRMDDSVVQARNGGLAMLRRSRGFVPASFDLGKASPKPILAVGGELKNTVTLVKGDRAYVSEHLGDLKDPLVFDHFRQAIDHLCRLYDVRPELVVTDLHPEYLSSQYAFDRMDMDILQVQHHHAHVVSCMVEHGLVDRVIGISADGVGLGTDQTAWGCELLIVDRSDFIRGGYLEPFPVPGGDAGARQTFRPALGVLHRAFGDEAMDHPLAERVCPDRQTRKMIIQMIEKNIQSPRTSSLGRLFDAVAAMTGVASANRFEGQAPMRLEDAAKGRTDRAWPFNLRWDNDVQIIDVREMIRALAGDIAHGQDTSDIADAFHNTVARFLVQSAKALADKYGIDKIVLSGGCFANRNLSGQVRRGLSAEGLICYEHSRIPCNDGGLSLGQATIGVEKLLRDKEQICV